MLEDYELRGVLREAAIYVDAAVMAARMMGVKGEAEQRADDGVQAILAFLEKAAEDLERATSGQAATPPHSEIVYPTKAMALKAIEALQLDDAVGFQIRRDGEGRCLLRIWFAGDPV